MPKEERILVTAALPYANGPLHIGHAIGAYIPADVYTRYNRLVGNDVIYICGTDEHGTPITVTAEQEGVTEKEIIDKYHKIQEDAFNNLGIDFDNFSGTAREIHYKISQDFFTKIYNKGLIETKTVERPYCPNCKRFLPDRYVKGTCPNCKSTDQRGDQCEKCGKQLEPHELLDPYCAICHGKPEQRKTKHWFFKLSEFSNDLEKWVERNKHWPANARNFALGWIKEGLEDRSITRDLKWGIPVPLKEAKDKVLYVWFDAPIGYISSTKEKYPDTWEDWWRNDETKLVHFIGKDNIPFHAVIWPAVLMAYNKSLSNKEKKYILPWQIASNEFLNLEGQKMSTSRRWVIWLHDVLKEFDADVLRYYLLSISPESSDSDFSLEEFKDKVNNELIGTLGNFINRTLTFIENKKEGMIPQPSSERDQDDDNIENDIKGFPKDIGLEISGFRLKAALGALLHYAQRGNQYFQKKEPWKNNPDTTLYLCANLCRSLAIVMSPFLPFSAEKIWNMLNLEGSAHEQDWSSALELKIKPGHRIGKVKALYKKIENEDIQNFKEKYLKIKKEEVNIMNVDFSEFNKLDLRIGIIKEIRDHPNADKLYLLKIDIGNRIIQSVAGLKANYNQNELIGRKVAVVTNLKPVKIRGYDSEGMLLAAVDESGGPILLIPEKDVKVGSKIK